MEINKRAATSDLLVYVNINLVAMDGGHKSVATGLASYKSLRHHHNAKTMQHSRSFMDQHRSELHSSNWRMGRLIADSGVKVFQIETTLNTDTFPPQMRFLHGGSGNGRPRTEPPTWPRRRRWPGRRTGWPGRSSTRCALPTGSPVSRPARSRPSTPVTTENVYRQQLVAVEGQTDILTLGSPTSAPTTSTRS